MIPNKRFDFELEKEKMRVEQRWSNSFQKRTFEQTEEEIARCPIRQMYTQLLPADKGIEYYRTNA